MKNRPAFGMSPTYGTDSEIVRDRREAPAISSSDFNIDFVFAPNVPVPVQGSFYTAADKWESIITGDLPSQDVSVYYGECGGSQGYIGNVDDLLIFVSMGNLGGRSGPVGRANVCVSALRGGNTPLPVVGWVRINQDASDDWDTVTELFDAIVTHEIGHVLGFNSSTLYGSGYMRFHPSRHFAGPLANEAFDEQGGASYKGATVPMADSSHWHDDVLSGEIMAPSIASSSVISR